MEYGVILWNKDQEMKESINYWVPHQVEEPTSRRCIMERWVIHIKASKTNHSLRETLA